MNRFRYSAVALIVLAGLVPVLAGCGGQTPVAVDGLQVLLVRTLALEEVGVAVDARQPGRPVGALRVPLGIDVQPVTVVEAGQELAITVAAEAVVDLLGDGRRRRRGEERDRSEGDRRAQERHGGSLRGVCGAALLPLCSGPYFLP